MSETKDGRIHFVKDESTGKMTFYGEGESASFVKTIDIPKIAQEINELEHTAADDELAELEAKQTPKVIEKTIGGKVRFLRRLEWEEIPEIGFAVARSTNGNLDIRAKGVMRSFLVAMLEACVMRDKGGELPYFTRAKAAKYVKAQDPMILGDFFDEITALNPALLPKGVTVNPTETLAS